MRRTKKNKQLKNHDDLDKIVHLSIKVSDFVFASKKHWIIVKIFPRCLGGLLKLLKTKFGCVTKPVPC